MLQNKHTKSAAFARRAMFGLQAAVLASVGMMPLLGNSAHAAQLTERKITMSTTKVSATSATYKVSFKTATADTIKGVVVDFCSNSPLIGSSCSTSFGLDVDSATVANKTGINDLTVNGATTATTFVLTNSTGNGLGAGATVSFDIVGVTNPNYAGTFYARVLTYTDDAEAAGYSSIDPGSYLDDGGVALSTANQLTVSAIVQEQLEFCVGTTTTDDETSDVTTEEADTGKCSTGFNGTATCGTAVNLGVLDTSTVSVSPVDISGEANPGRGNACNGVAMVRTNASNGVAVAYYAEQAASGTNNLRTLRVAGATCAAIASNTDQCIDAAGDTAAPFNSGVEKFGMTVAAVNCYSTTAYDCAFGDGDYHLIRNAQYDGNGSNSYAADTGVQTETSGSYAWHDSDGVAQVIATTTANASDKRVVDDEALILKFAAANSITTPTGSYSVTSTYIATSTF